MTGASPGVGVTGYTLGGGLGFLARRYGLAANALTRGRQPHRRLGLRTGIEPDSGSRRGWAGMVSG
jgi:hypothetical protein